MHTRETKRLFCSGVWGRLSRLQPLRDCTGDKVDCGGAAGEEDEVAVQLPGQVQPLPRQMARPVQALFLRREVLAHLISSLVEVNQAILAG